MNCLLVAVTLDHIFLSHKLGERMSHIVQLVNLHPGSRIYQSPDGLVHICRRAEFGYGLESAIQLVTHNGDDVVYQDKPFLIDQGLSLYPRKNWLASIKLRIYRILRRHLPIF